jgi:hypothetical protein
LRRRPPSRRRRGPYAGVHLQPLEATMGKYFIAWLLGVPGVLLVLLYLFFR